MTPHVSGSPNKVWGPKIFQFEVRNVLIRRFINPSVWGCPFWLLSYGTVMCMMFANYADESAVC